MKINIKTRVFRKDKPFLLMMRNNWLPVSKDAYKEPIEILYESG
jgi:hypothetical protein